MGLLLFLRGYSPAAGLHGGREGGLIGRYKHSHRPIVLACTVIAYPSSHPGRPSPLLEAEQVATASLIPVSFSMP